ncbi:nucleoside-triphosphatase [Calidifontibacillus oryziterrae]|uniref:nucleoside-triphosphatase n=1 Tax=Calidifontibacillus oryziterrae TaxID=1191699 RepID=UPI0002FB352B|nr:nucleoside-triphosphatase [Calidifontibacillus oryziterrae]
MNNIFLTGEKQVGKSTIINNIIDNFTGNICGFKTLLETKEGRQFYFSGFNPMIDSIPKIYICKKDNNDKLEGITEAFDDFGVKILEDSLNDSSDLIIMDELGVFENQAYRFQKSVYKCLNSAIPVIGVIKAKPSLFLDTIRNRDDVTIVNVTKENREQAYLYLKSLLEQF